MINLIKEDLKTTKFTYNFKANLKYTQHLKVNLTLLIQRNLNVNIIFDLIDIFICLIRVKISIKNIL